MAEAKTKPTFASVEDYLASRASPEQLADCKALMALLKRVTKQSPKMWGPSIVGFGSYSYKYESGRTGESCLTGFAVRGKELVAYLVVESPEQQALLAKLGKHKMGKACQGPGSTGFGVGGRDQASSRRGGRRLTTRSTGPATASAVSPS
jgi:hypothetical protein